jgi:hypothetical protein
MLIATPLAPGVIIALGLTVAMIAATVFLIFYHDRKHEEIDQWVDFAFSREGLRHALGYYRFIAVWMLVFYVLFSCSCLILQAEGYRLFAEGDQPVQAGPLGVLLFTLDLVLRGGFFDFMQHFDLHVTALHLNRANPWFVWYAFVFRMFYGLTMFKILFSFVWIYGKIRITTKVLAPAAHAGPRLPFLKLAPRSSE